MLDIRTVYSGNSAKCIELHDIKSNCEQYNNGGYRAL